MIYKFRFYTFIILTIPLVLISSDKRTVIHPYVSFHNSSTNENAVAFNGDKIYLATKFYGHIYEYYYMADSTYFVDKFILRDKDSNKNAAGAMVYHQNYLYTATTYAFQRIPEIYIFNTNQTGEQILPDTTIDLMKHDPTLMVFYDPIVIGDYIYWGTYHSKGGSARLAGLHINDQNYIKEDIIIVHSTEDNAPKTYSLARINDLLYVSTNTGKILRFKLNLFDGSIIGELEAINLGIDEVSKDVQHLKADPVNNLLWANTTLQNSLFCVSNPDSDYEVKRTWHNIINTRIYLGPDGYLYGQGYNQTKRKIQGYKIRRTETGFNYRIVGGLSYSKFGAILGGGYTNQGTPMMIGEDFRKVDENPDLKHMRTFNLNTNELKKHHVKAVEINTVGNTLNALAADNAGTLYLSTYQTGYMYKINSDFEDKDLLPPGRLRYSYQADVIKNYPKNPGSMIFGIYGGTGRSSRVIFFDISAVHDQWKHWVLPHGPNGIKYERLKAIAINPLSNEIYIGTSNQLLDSKGYPGKIYKLTINDLKKDKGNIEDWKELNYRWPENYPGRDDPSDFLAMASDGNYLYCIIQQYDRRKGLRENRFVRIDTDKDTSLISENDLKIEEKYNEWSTHCDKAICVDGSTLLVGYGSKIFRYNLNRFAINNPGNTYEFGKEPIVAILSDGTHYYICQPHHIRIISKDFSEERIIQPPEDNVENDYFETISLNGKENYLYAITHNGILYKFSLDQE